MVDTHSSLLKLWKDRCTVYTKKEVVSQINKRTTFTDEVFLSNVPCKLSFESLSTTNQADNAATIVQKAKLFLSPDVAIPPGSKISVNRNGLVIDYEQSGEPGIFNNHQEIPLDIFKGWA